MCLVSLCEQWKPLQTTEHKSPGNPGLLLYKEKARPWSRFGYVLRINGYQMNSLGVFA